MLDTLEELLRQISLGEDTSLELKDLRFKGAQVNEPHRNSMADELAAMANTSTGVFVLGVDDRTRTIVGIPEEKLDAVETWIRGIANDLITPALMCRIRKLLVPWEDGIERTIIRIDVPRSLFVHKSPGGIMALSVVGVPPTPGSRLYEQGRPDSSDGDRGPSVRIDFSVWSNDGGILGSAVGT
jgi:hypothetical protein